LEMLQNQRNTRRQEAQMSKRQRREEDDAPGQACRFALGDSVKFGSESWTVSGYHRIGKEWEILFRSAASGVKRSIPCKQLELYVE
jgi:hypothetical protein